MPRYLIRVRLQRRGATRESQWLKPRTKIAQLGELRCSISPAQLTIHHQNWIYMEYLLLAIGKFRWYVRYPAAALMLWAAWYMFSNPPGIYMIPAIFAICAAVITKEASPSLALFCGAIWLWPDDFLSTPLAQLTLGIIFSALASGLMFLGAPVVGFVLYIMRINAECDASKSA